MRRQTPAGRIATAIALVGLVAAFAGCGGGSSGSGSAASDTLPTDDATTTEAESPVAQSVDETCDDLIGFLTLAKDVDIARGGKSVDDVEKLQTAASDLASKASADPGDDNPFLEGEPRESLTRMGDAYAGYLTLLSQKGLDPGPDALQNRDIADRLDLSLEAAVLLEWIGARCSEDVKGQLEQLANG